MFLILIKKQQMSNKPRSDADIWHDCSFVSVKRTYK